MTCHPTDVLARAVRACRERGRGNITQESGNECPSRKTQDTSTGKERVERAPAGTEEWGHEKRHGDETHLACRSLCCSLDTPPSAPSDGRRDTRRQQNSSRTWHTTSTRACGGGCTHARTHMRHPFYIARGASAYRQSPGVRVREDVWVAVSAAGNSAQREWYV